MLRPTRTESRHEDTQGLLSPRKEEDEAVRVPARIQMAI